MQRCSRASWMNTRHGLPRLSNPELNDLSLVFGAGWAVRLDQANGSIQPSWAIRSKLRGVRRSRKKLAVLKNGAIMSDD